MDYEAIHSTGGLDSDGVLVLTIPKGEIGFGFNVRGQMDEGGTMKAVNGVLYGPLHEVTNLLPGGNAEKFGLKIGDKILEINGIVVEGYMHKVVIEMLRNSGSPLVLTVVRPLNMRRFNRTADNPDGEEHVISIPDYQVVEDGDTSYIVFNVYVDGRQTCSRRYSHFEKLLEMLRPRFPRLQFQPLPGKKIFALSNQQLVERRRGLEKFLVDACSTTEVFHSNLMRQFLVLESQQSPLMVSMKILMPDHSLLEVKVKPEDTTERVYSRVADRLGLRTDVMPYFALFEVTSDDFERKLTKDDLPYRIFLGHEASGLSSGVSFRKWLFSKAREASICRDPLVLSLICGEAMERMRKNDFSLGERKSEVENLVQSERRAEVMEIIRGLEFYDRIVFPHCPSDSRKNGHVTCSISYDGFQLAACSILGVSEDNIREFGWDQILSYEDLSDAFSFTFSQEHRPPRRVEIYTKYSRYMTECFDRVSRERSECNQY